MIRLFKLFLDEARAEAAYIWWHRFGILSLATLAFLALSFTFVAFYKPSLRHFEDYVWADVQFTFGGSTEQTAFRMFATVKLPNGTQTTVITTKYHLAVGTLDTICLRQMKSEEGNRSWRWVANKNCA